MRYKRIILAAVCIGWITGGKVAYAAVEPHEYKEKEVKINTDYLRDESLLKRKESLSDELKKISFSGEKQSISEQAITTVFQTNVYQQTVIEAQAERLQLFSADHEYKQEIRVSESGQSSAVPLQLILIIAAATGIIGILVLILSKNNGNRNGDIRNV